VVTWQELAVAVVVVAAVAFLVRRVAGRRTDRQKPAQTFVPLSNLKKSRRPPDDTPGCH
jgi:hypothetical protein